METKEYIPEIDFEINIGINTKIKCKKSILIKYFSYFKTFYNDCDLSDYIDNDFSKHEILKKMLKIICIKDKIESHEFYDILKIKSYNYFNNDNIDEIISEKVSLLIDMFTFFETEDVIRRVFNEFLITKIGKLNIMKKYIKYNKEFVFSFVIYACKELDKIYTLQDSYGYEGTYTGLKRYYVGPKQNMTHLKDNSMKQDIYDIISIIIFWKKDILSSHVYFRKDDFINEEYYGDDIIIFIKDMILSLQKTGYIFSYKYKELYDINKDIIPYPYINFTKS